MKRPDRCTSRTVRALIGRIDEAEGSAVLSRAVRPLAAPRRFGVVPLISLRNDIMMIEG